MASFSALAALQLPIQLRGIQLARPTDLLLDLDDSHVLGFVVRCGDESVRFLPYGAAQLRADEIAVQSALMLLEDLAFYVQRGVSLRSLLGAEVEARGTLRDVVFDVRGRVEAYEIDDGAGVLRIPPDGAQLVPRRASAA
jgi:hypothetical protein